MVHYLVHYLVDFMSIYLRYVKDIIWICESSGTSANKGITILLEKGSVMLNADKMDITDEVLKKLNKEFPELKVSRN